MKVYIHSCQSSDEPESVYGGAWACSPE